MRHICFLGTGKYLPDNRISAEYLDKKHNLPLGTVFKKSGVESRYFVKTETASHMGVKAAREALLKAGLDITDIDCIVCASATSEQAMPSTAALISQQFGDEAVGIPAFDINNTCLSFMTALDMMSYVIQAGRYQNVLIVSTEIASVGLNWDDIESYALFGDGAAAVVLSITPPKASSKILAQSFHTYSEGAHLAEIPGGGTRFHPRHFLEKNGAPHLFKMEGRPIYKLSAKVLPPLINQLFNIAQLSMEDLQLVIPHQASLSALDLMGRRLNIPEHKLMMTINKYGNTISASIPMTLHDAIIEKRIKRGDLILLLGTAAGLSVGGIIIEY